MSTTGPDGFAVRWRWTPPPEMRADLVAYVSDEYVVVENSSCVTGVMVIGRWSHQWRPNVSARPVVAELLRRVEALKAAERTAFDAGYKWGYGNGHVDGEERDSIFDSHPDGAYEMWVEEDDRRDDR